MLAEDFLSEFMKQFRNEIENAMDELLRSHFNALFHGYTTENDYSELSDAEVMTYAEGILDCYERLTGLSKEMPKSGE